VGVVTVVAAGVAVVSGVGVRVDPGIDVGVVEGISTGTGSADGTAQPPSKNTTIDSANNDFLGLILVSKSPRSQP
jgi:hypothetical protein